MKSVLIAFTLLLIPALASAQGGPGGPGMMARANVANLLIEHRADVGLTDEQVGKLDLIAKAIDEKNAPVIEELRKAREAGADRETMMASMQKIRAHSDDAFQKEIRPLLNAEQVTKAEKVIADARQRRRGGS